MKVKPPEGDVTRLPRSKGSLLPRNTKFGIVFQSWPRSPPYKYDPYQWFKQEEFKYAAGWSTSVAPIQQLSANSLASGTPYVPRDLLIQAMYASAYEIRGPDGAIWPRFRDVTNNPQYVLEQLGDTIGGMIVRAPIGWVIMPPGEAGQVITMGSQLPDWANPGAVDAGDRWIGAAPSVTGTTAPFANKGIKFSVTEVCKFAAMSTWMFSVSRDYTPMLWSLVGTTLDQLLWSGAQFSTDATNTEFAPTWRLGTPVPLQTGVDYAIIVACTNIAGTTQSGLRTFNNQLGGLPLVGAKAYRVESANQPLASGQTISIPSIGQPPYAILPRFTA